MIYESASIWARFVAPPLILLAGVGGMFALGEKQPELKPQEAESAPLVETDVVQLHDGGLEIEVDGVVVPFREIQLAAEVAGRVVRKSVECRAGTFVKAGTLLYEIDPQTYQLEITRLEQSLLQADASVQEIEVEIENTQTLARLAEEELQLQRNELKRVETLSRVVSESDMDRAKRAELAARNALAVLRNQSAVQQTRRLGLQSARQLAQAQLEKAKLDLARTRIVAPVDGVVVDDQVEQDSFVQPGTLLAVFEDTSAVEVRCDLRIDELYWLWQHRDGAASESPTPLPASGYELPPTPATITFHIGRTNGSPAHGGGTTGRQYTWQGRLSRYDGLGLDQKTRTVPCRILVEAPRRVTVRDSEGDNVTGMVPAPPALVRGMFVKVALHAQPEGHLLRVAESALRPGRSVWRVRDGRLEVLSDVQTVRLWHASDEHSDDRQPAEAPREVKSTERSYWLVDPSPGGLAAGDKVIVTPLTAVTTGMPVREKSSS